MGGGSRVKRGLITPMFDEPTAVIPRPDVMRKYRTDDRARIYLKEDVLKETEVIVVAKKIEDIPEEVLQNL